jgi:hypothetical protein
VADGIASTSELPGVYRAIAAVMEAVGQDGISKSRQNKQQGYAYRGIDEVYNALAPIMARHHLIIVPRVLTREKTEQASKSGGTLFYVVVQVEFDIICADDGSKITACTWGEAMDSADKATNKAMSAAYKYMAMQTFCIPTEGDNDADDSHHEVRSNAAPSRAPVKSQLATGAGANSPAPAPVQTMSKGDAREDYGLMVEEMRRITSTHELKAWGKMNAERVKLQPKDWQGEIRKSYQELMEGLQHQERAAAEAEEAFADAR